MLRPGNFGNDDNAEEAFTFPRTSARPHQEDTPSHFTSPNPFDALDVFESTDVDTSNDELAIRPVAPPPAPRAARTHNIRASPPPPLRFDAPRSTPAPSPAPAPTSHADLSDPFDTSFDPFSDGCSESPDPLDLLPRALLASLDDNLFQLPSSDPISYNQSQASKYSVEWEKATVVEIDKLERLDCWELVDANKVPKEHKVIDSRIAYRSKRDKLGHLIQHKARLVAKGYYCQKEGRNFKETFAPVCKFTLICALAAVAARKNYHLEQADIDSAYIHADLPPDKIVYISPPEGMQH